MREKIILVSVLTALMLTLGCQTTSKSNVDYTTNYVDEINFVNISPNDAQSFFDLLTNTFGLTAAWPMNDYYGVKAGGVNVGNVIFDINEIEGNTNFGIGGIGFKPALNIHTVRGGLEDRGIYSNDPEFFDAWTTMDTKDMLYEKSIYFFEYNFESINTINRKNPMKIEYVNEITINVTDYEESVEKWDAFFAPLKTSSQGFWQPGSGPAIRIQKGSEDKIASIQLKVKSLETAKNFLNDNGILGDSSKNSVFTNPDLTNDILMEFKE